MFQINYFMRRDEGLVRDGRVWLLVVLIVMLLVVVFRGII